LSLALLYQKKPEAAKRQPAATVSIGLGQLLLKKKFA
jgi:hypothetical protein